MSIFLRLFAGYILQVLPFSTLCLYPFSGHFRTSNRKTFLTTIGLIASLGLIFSASCIFLGNQIHSATQRFTVSNLIFMFCLIPCFVWYIFIVNDIRQKKLFIFSFTVLSALIITSINNTATTLICSDDIGDGYPYYDRALLILFCFTACIIPILLRFIKNYFLPQADYLSAKEYRSLCFISTVLFLILFCCFIPLSYSSLDNPVILLQYLSLLISVFLLYRMIFQVFYITKRKLIAEQELYYSEMQYQIQENQYQKLIHQIEETHRIRHDYRHHLVTIQSFVASNEIDKLQAYLQENLEHIDELSIYKYSNNKTINYLVSYYMSLAKEHQIQMKPVIQCPDTLTITTSELSILLGNLLENAYHAALSTSHDNRFINLNMMKKGQSLVISMDNGFDGHVLMKNNTYHSTKENHTGYGLDSIQNIVAKHGGTSQFSHNHTTFHVDILITD